MRSNLQVKPVNTLPLPILATNPFKLMGMIPFAVAVGGMTYTAGGRPAVLAEFALHAARHSHTLWPERSSSPTAVNTPIVGYVH